MRQKSGDFMLVLFWGVDIKCVKLTQWLDGIQAGRLSYFVRCYAY